MRTNTDKKVVEYELTKLLILTLCQPIYDILCLDTIERHLLYILTANSLKSQNGTLFSHV